jgi:branched-chain amino acid transport system ATP-binding protein
MTPILDVCNLGIKFGGLQALDDFNVQVCNREIVGLIGPNGAGKTTVFNLLTNVYQPSRGSIHLIGKSTKGKTTHEVTQFGIARTFQNIRLFKDVTVIENVLTALHNSMKYSLATSLLRLPAYWKQEHAAKNLALELLDVFHMCDLADAQAGSLPYGAQRRLEIVRALATNPKVLLLDEPAAGMNPSETSELMRTIRDIRDKFDVAIILIEHDMNLVMGICERILVLNYGLIIAHGKPEEIKNNPVVIEAYLGQQRGE